MPSAIVDEEPTPPMLEEALQQVTLASETETKCKYPVLKSAIEKIETHALTNGMANTILKRLLNAITSNLLDHTSRNALIKCLYPAEPASSDVVYNIIGSLGHGTLKASLPTQQALIKWLIMVYELVEDTTALSRCYAVLFNLLDTLSIQAGLCHLLSLITTKNHIKPFRIMLLNDLLRTAGEEHALQKLALVYEGYAPGSMDVADIPKRALFGFPHPDAEWGAQLERIQEVSKTHAESLIGQDSDNEYSSARAAQGAPATTGDQSSSIRLDDSICNLSKPLSTELTLSDLRSRTFQSRTALMPAGETAASLDHLLTPLFEQELKKLEGGRKAGKTLFGILEEVLVFTHLQTTILNPLETALLSTPTDALPTSLVILLEFYTSLLAHWTSHLLSAATPPTPTQTTTIQSLTARTSTLTLTLLSTTPPTLTTTTAILHHQRTHLPLLSPPLSLPLPPPSPLTISTLLFTSPTLPTLNALSSLLAAYKHAFETSPNPPTTTHPTTHHPPAEIRTLNASLIDTCNLLFRSRAFNTTDSHALGCLVPSQTIETLAEYTQSLEPPQPLGGLFALSCHSALAGLSIVVFREMEEEWAEGKGEGDRVRVRHAGPVTQRSLTALGREAGVKIDWRQYRVAVLKWLHRMGVTGIKELGEATMKGLMGEQEGSKGSQETTLSQ